MVLNEIFQRFVEESPITVMVRGVLEKVLALEKLDELFEKKACPTKKLKLTTLTGLAIRPLALLRGNSR